MNPTAALPGSMTWMGIRLSSGSRCPQSPKGLPLHLLNRFSVATVPSNVETPHSGQFGNSQMDSCFGIAATYPREIASDIAEDFKLGGRGQGTGVQEII